MNSAPNICRQSRPSLPLPNALSLLGEGWGEGLAIAVTAPHTFSFSFSYASPSPWPSPRGRGNKRLLTDVFWRIVLWNHSQIDLSKNRVSDKLRRRIKENVL